MTYTHKYTTKTVLVRCTDLVVRSLPLFRREDGTLRAVGWNPRLEVPIPYRISVCTGRPFSKSYQP